MIMVVVLCVWVCARVCMREGHTHAKGWRQERGIATPNRVRTLDTIKTWVRCVDEVGGVGEAQQVVVGPLPMQKAVTATRVWIGMGVHLGA